MKVSIAVKLAVVLIALLCGAGCAHTHYVVNASDAILYDVTVVSGRQQARHGHLLPKCVRAYKGPLRITLSPPPVVAWSAAYGGPPVAKAVEMDADPGRRTVVFVLDGKSVKAQMLDRPR